MTAASAAGSTSGSKTMASIGAATTSTGAGSTGSSNTAGAAKISSRSAASGTKSDSIAVVSCRACGVDGAANKLGSMPGTSIGAIGAGAGGVAKSDSNP